MVRRAAFAIAIAIAVSVAWPARTLASPESDARDLFTRATQALESGDASLARDLLQEAIRVHPSLPAYFNLAVALRRAGQVLEAVEVLESLLRNEHGTLTQEQHDAAARQRDRTREDLATILLDFAPGPVDVRASVDGAQPVPLDAVTRALTVNPGTHRIELHAEGYEFDRAEAVAVRASTVRVRVSFHAVLLSPRSAAENGDRDPDARMTDDSPSGISPWWFVGAGAVTVAVVVLVVVLAAPSTSDPNAAATFTALSP